MKDHQSLVRTKISVDDRQLNEKCGVSLDQSDTNVVSGGFLTLFSLRKHKGDDFQFQNSDSRITKFNFIFA